MINEFISFNEKQWLNEFENVSKMHSIVCESLYNSDHQKGFIRGIDHSPIIGMMMNGEVDPKYFTEPCQLNIELDVGCTCADIVPAVSYQGDALVNVVEMNNKSQNDMAYIVAGCEDGSVLMSEMMTPEHKTTGFQKKYISSYDGDIIKTYKDRVHLHKDSVTSIKQRPNYEYQLLTTSLDGDAILSLVVNSHANFELITEFTQLFSGYTNCMYEEAIGYATWMDSNCFIAKNNMYGHLVVQDVRDGQSKPSQQVYSVNCKINDMSLAYPYMALACDDGNLSIIDLRRVSTDRANSLGAINNVFKEGEAGMTVKMLQDTIRVYGGFEKTGIYGYRYNEGELNNENMEWYGEYDSDVYGIPKSIHIIQQEKKEDDGSTYGQDVLGISSYNGLYGYAFVKENTEIT